MIIFRQYRIYRQDLQANPNILYIFGDNLDREGMGGQAKEMRGEPNAFGIATKRSISHNYPKDYFFDSDEDVIKIIDDEFEQLHRELYKNLSYFNAAGKYIEKRKFFKYKALCIPYDGIGTGLARLKENAPKLLDHINSKLKKLESL